MSTSTQSITTKSKPIVPSSSPSPSDSEMESESDVKKICKSTLQSIMNVCDNGINICKSTTTSLKLTNVIGTIHAGEEQINLLSNQVSMSDVSKLLVSIFESIRVTAHMEMKSNSSSGIEKEQAETILHGIVQITATNIRKWGPQE